MAPRRTVKITTMSNGSQKPIASNGSESPSNVVPSELLCPEYLGKCNLPSCTIMRICRFKIFVKTEVSDGQK